MYEEAKAASASQIDRFYLSYCGGNGTGAATVGVNESNIANYSGPSFTVGEPDNDSDQVLMLINYLLQILIIKKDILMIFHSFKVIEQLIYLTLDQE